jgi:hypothetical protein
MEFAQHVLLSTARPALQIFSAKPRSGKTRSAERGIIGLLSEARSA